MRLVPISQCQPGDILARSVFSDNGTTLIGAGVVLTHRMLDRLKKMNIIKVYIQDSRTADILLEDTVSERTRQEAMAVIHETFRSVKDSPQKWQQTFHDKQFGRQFRQVMSSVVDELKQNRTAMNLLGDAWASNHYIFSHSFNVALYATALAIKSGYAEKELIEIGMGALLHDVGKMAIPCEILQKPGQLTEEEFEIMKTHTEYGFEMLRRLDEIPLLAAHCAYQHHERCDGSGYPRQLKGEEIHPYARIIAVCDVFDALTSHRVYRPSVLPHEAMEVLFAGAGTLFEQRMVEHLRDTIALYPLGMTVTLNTGEVGVVIDYNKGLPSRPILRILTDENGQPLEHPHEYDLSKRMHLMIVQTEALL
ncbi:HD-GYP domain-containing protein [Brevibacillus sp. H7]|uniref:HD-GYP domain-containing protein n=1 Tax=Brevibacillus sp. H7 TaxID=3349138 RepID=UPI003824443F